MTKEGLFRVINNGNKLIAQNGHDAILAILKNVRPVKLIPKLIEETQSKNPFVRKNCAEYI
jgi:hypothetical protein